MAGKVLGVILFLLVVCYVKCQSPPVMKDSFIAWGEIVQPLPDMGVVLQTSFEESYDASTKNAAFFMWLSGKNLTFIKNSQTNQTFLYTETENKKLQCSETSETEWVTTDFAPGLLSFEDDDGTVKFSLTQLFSIPEKYLLAQLRGKNVTYRGIPARSWTYEIRSRDEDTGKDINLSITSYWSDGSWNTSAGKKVIPLGFNVSKMTWTDPVSVDDYVINVFGFVPNAYDHKYFEPYQGIICASRKSTLKFPSVKDIKAISIHSETALPDYQEVRYVDTWFDPLSQMVRVDVERIIDENPLEFKQKHYQSEIAIGKMGVVYRWGYYKGEAECKVIPFSDYKNDLQNLFDIKQDLKRWKMGKIFGLNDTSYVYIGKTTKNDVPCHLFQGVRTDWPDKDSGMQSLWEWCFNVNMSNVNDIVMFQGDEFGLISANIIILSDPNKDYNGYRMNHHFYEVKAQDPKILDSTSFDIGRCFNDSQKRGLQFYLNVDIGEDNKLMAENATSDVNFLQKWKAAIYKHSGIREYTLRISNVRATIDENKVYIKFFLLNVHENLPKDIKDYEISSYDAETNFRKKVNDGKVSITYNWNKGKATTLRAVEHSVGFQIDPKFQPQTPPPLPTSSTGSTTPFVFSLRTEPDKGTSQSDHTVVSKDDTVTTDDSITDKTSPVTGGDTTTPSSKKDDHTAKLTGHQPGTVAGVSIAMLLIGISIGSAGTFYKFVGLPACVKS